MEGEHQGQDKKIADVWKGIFYALIKTSSYREGGRGENTIA